jgi:hypothetical protein
MPIKSRKIVTTENVDKNIYYCRKCGLVKKETDFYSCSDAFLDKNGRLSICKECCNIMYDNFIENEKTIEKTIYRMCKILNIKYSEEAISMTKSRIETSKSHGKDINAIFGIYKSQLMVQDKTDNGDPYLSGVSKFTFEEPSKDSIVFKEIETDRKDFEYLKKIWGKVESIEEYDFLEEEYLRWASPIGNVTHSEEVLIREICHYQNQIRKFRIEGNVAKVDEISKMMRAVMKDSMLTPALQNAANNGKNADCFGVWIKDIETRKPAEWYLEQTKYKDIDGLTDDINDIKRNMKNFITNSRDFSTTELESLYSDMDSED